MWSILRDEPTEFRTHDAQERIVRKSYRPDLSVYGRIWYLMRQQVLLDTGPLVALIDRRDRASLLGNDRTFHNPTSITFL